MSELPLSTLRHRLDAEGAYWSLVPLETPTLALVQRAGSEIRFPVRLEREAAFSARVLLLPADWRDGVGSLRVAVGVRPASGEPRLLWEATLGTAELLELPWELPAECAIPADARELTLAAHPLQEAIPKLVGRVAWAEAAIEDGAQPPWAARSAASADGVQRPPRERTDAPLVSVLVPVHDPPPAMLDAAVGSVMAQEFGDWELCLVDDGSRDPAVIEALDRFASADSRVRLTRRDDAGGISAATNAALELATGTYVALLDHDDVLVTGALGLVAEAIDADPALDMIYSDEAVLSEQGTLSPIRKPDFSPESLCALMYTCHLGVYRRTLALELGGFRTRFDGCQDYDFVLRLIERSDRVGHIPTVLYHWRAHQQSTAGGDAAKPYAYVAQPRAIAEHFQRIGVDATVQFGPTPGLHRVSYRVPASTTVSVILAADTQVVPALAACAPVWLEQLRDAWNLVLAGPPADLAACAAVLAGAGFDPRRVREVTTTATASRAARLSAAAGATDAEQLLIMQSPMVGLTHDWATRLLGYSLQSEIATAGPIVLSPDGRVADAGVAFSGGLPVPVQYGVDGAAATFVPANVSAVSGALAVGADVLERLDGLRAGFADLVLVDLGLRAVAAGMRNVLVPDVRLGLLSGDYVVNDLEAIRSLHVAWSDRGPDPFYHPPGDPPGDD